MVEENRVLYSVHLNPVHALEAYRICRAAKVEIPEWTLEVFDQWAEVLCVDAPKGAKAIADALRLDTMRVGTFQ